MSARPLARVAVSAPASTSNLGPGFDVFGLALGLRNELVLELWPGRGPALVEIEGEGSGSLPRGEENLLVRAARLALPRRLPGRLRLRAKNRIPLARGLGSSAAAAVAGLWAGAHLLGPARLGGEALEALAARLEGHPDNVAPCVRGGLTASYLEAGRPRARSLPVHPSLWAAACCPGFELMTRRARAVLPRRVPLEDAVFNLSRAALLAAELAAPRRPLLALLMEDRLHQPYRAPLVPGLREALAAALSAGAEGAALSGSGPTALALGPRSAAARAGAAMRRAFARRGIAATALLLPVDRRGVEVRR